MKKQYLFLSLSLILTLIFFTIHISAQSNDRMLIYSKSGEVFRYRAEHIDSIKFLTEDVDLTLNPEIIPHPNGQTGAMKLGIGHTGKDVQYIKVILPETYQVSKMNDFQLLRLFDPSSPARTGIQIFDVEKEKEYDLTGMQRGYNYTAVFLPYDKEGCPGNITKVEFSVPLEKLSGNPNITINFTDVSSDGFKVKFEPNSDTKEYFYLCDETDGNTREQMLQAMGIPDMKHYIVQFGKDFKTQKAHKGNKEQTYNGLKPGVQYTMYIVLVDANGQYSDLHEEFSITTQHYSKQYNPIFGMGAFIERDMKKNIAIYTLDFSNKAINDTSLPKDDITIMLIGNSNEVNINNLSIPEGIYSITDKDNVSIGKFIQGFQENTLLGGSFLKSYTTNKGKPTIRLIKDGKVKIKYTDKEKQKYDIEALLTLDDGSNISLKYNGQIRCDNLSKEQPSQELPLPESGLKEDLTNLNIVEAYYNYYGDVRYGSEGKDEIYLTLYLDNSYLHNIDLFLLIDKNKYPGKRKLPVGIYPIRKWDLPSPKELSSIAGYQVKDNSGKKVILGCWYTNLLDGGKSRIEAPLIDGEIEVISSDDSLNVELKFKLKDNASTPHTISGIFKGHLQ